MNGVYLLLGSNIEDRLNNLNIAVTLLNSGDLTMVKQSAIYETAPWGKLDQEWFLNVAIKVNTSLEPAILLKFCQEVEQQMGRERKEKWGPRTIDIDILYYDDLIIDQPDLKVPHPGIPERKFTLILLNDLEPKGNHPVLLKSHAQLLNECEDNSVCLKTNHRLNLELD